MRKVKSRDAQKKIRPSHGFTLIEMVLVIILVSIVAGLGSKMMAAGFKGYLTSKNLSQAGWQGRIAIERISRELRTIRSATAQDLTISPNNQITFTDTNANTIRYHLKGSTLMRNNQPLADDITSITFTYLSNDGKTTAVSVDLVHTIIIDLNINSHGAVYKVRTAIHPRHFL